MGRDRVSMMWNHELLAVCIAIAVPWVVSAIDIDHWNPSRPLHHVNASGILHHFNNIVVSDILPLLRLVPLRLLGRFGKVNDLPRLVQVRRLRTRELGRVPVMPLQDDLDLADFQRRPVPDPEALHVHEAPVCARVLFLSHVLRNQASDDTLLVGREEVEVVGRAGSCPLAMFLHHRDQLRFVKRKTAVADSRPAGLLSGKWLGSLENVSYVACLDRFVFLLLLVLLLGLRSRFILRHKLGHDRVVVGVVGLELGW